MRRNRLGKDTVPFLDEVFGGRGNPRAPAGFLFWVRIGSVDGFKPLGRIISFYENCQARSLKNLRRTGGEKSYLKALGIITNAMARHLSGATRHHDNVLKAIA